MAEQQNENVDVDGSEEMSSEEVKSLAILRGNVERIEALVSHEYSLIGNRMVWFAISESFLFGAFASFAKDKAVFSVGLGWMLLWGIPLVGILFAFAAFISVRAAGRVLEVLDQARGNILQKMNLALKKHGHDPVPTIGNEEQRVSFNPLLKRTIAHGNFPQNVLPISMIVVWVVSVAFLYSAASQRTVEEEQTHGSKGESPIINSK
jgi:hypothetical protein